MTQKYKKMITSQKSLYWGEITELITRSGVARATFYRWGRGMRVRRSVDIKILNAIGKDARVLQAVEEWRKTLIIES